MSLFMFTSLKCQGYTKLGKENVHGGHDLINISCPNKAEILFQEGWYIEIHDESIICPNCLELDEIVNQKVI